MATDATLAQPEDLIEGGLDVLHRKALTILKRIRDSAVDPETGSKRGPTFPISKAAALVGRTASAIRDAERDGRLPSRDRTASGQDRKSVVTGQSVAVRVDLGGRRIIKKKKKN